MITYLVRQKLTDTMVAKEDTLTEWPIHESVAVLIRVWNKDADKAVASVKQALNNGVGLVVVVVKDEDPEHRGTVSTALKGLADQNHPGQIQVVEMREGYSWANALNAGFARIRLMNRGTVYPKNSEPWIQHVLTVSNEVEWGAHHVEQMLAATMVPYEMGVVGATLTGVDPEGLTISLGVTYQVPRCTFMLVSLGDYMNVGYFDPICDGFGGMEDVNFVLQMLLMSSSRFKMIEDTDIRVRVGVHHNQKEKEARELAAIRKIIAHAVNVVGDDTRHRVALRRALRALGIADLA